MPSTRVRRFTGRFHTRASALERVARVVHLEVDALVLVLEQQLAAVLEVAVLDVDERLAEVGQPEEQLVLHLLELAALDLPVARALVEAEGEELVARGRTPR